MQPLDSVYWTYGNGLTDSAIFDGLTQYDTAGAYNVLLEVKSMTCKAQKEKQIIVMEFPNIKASPDSVGACVGMDVIMTADSLNGEETDFKWIFTSIPDTLTDNPASRYFDDPELILSF